MLTLTIMRHGQAASGAGSDFDRRLTDAGRHQAGGVATLLDEAGISWKRIVCSPAVRALQTAEAAAAVMPAPGTPVTDPDLYDQVDPDALMAVLRRHAAGAASVALVAHNPGVSWLVRWLCPDCEASLDPADAVVLHCDADDWNDVGASCASLLLRTGPDDLFRA